jgi:uncharacterized membrane protein YidH (DUF202 family)
VPEAGAHNAAAALALRPCFSGEPMNATKLVAVVLIVAGVLALVYGNFSFTRETHELKLGPLELSVKEKQTVNVPMWAGIAAIAVGGALLLFGGKKG